MWHFRHFRTSHSHRPGLAPWGAFAVALAFLFCRSAAAPARPFPPDPVTELKTALKKQIPSDSSEDKAELTKALKERKADLEAKIDNLKNLGEMSRAMLLLEWHLDDPEAKVKANEEEVWSDLADRFAKGVRDTLKQPDESLERAIANLLAETAANARAFPSQTVLARRRLAGFTPDLVAIVESSGQRSSATRIAAARALARIDSVGAGDDKGKKDLNSAVRALESMLVNGDGTERRVAAHSLGEMVRVLVAGTERLSQENIPLIAVATIPAAVRGLRDADPEVRRLAIEAIDLPTVAIADRTLGEGGPPVMLKLAEALRDAASAPEGQSGPRLAQVVNDPDPAVRLAARRTISDIAYLALRMQSGSKGQYVPPDLGSPDKVNWTPSTFQIQQEDAPLPRRGADKADKADKTDNEDRPGKKAAKVLLQGLKGTVSDLAAGLTDPNPRSRLAAVEALEMIGEDARDAAPALARSVEDPDRFVRWAAARTLGKMSVKKEKQETQKPAAVETAVPALARLLWDEDLSLELAAAKALGQYGEAAKDAVGELGRRCLSGDSEIRIAAMHALENIGTDSAPAVPSLAAALRAEAANVRRTAAEVLGRFGPLAQSSVPALRAALNDSDGDVRRAASDALLAITAKPRTK